MEGDGGRHLVSGSASTNLGYMAMRSTPYHCALALKLLDAFGGGIVFSYFDRKFEVMAGTSQFYLAFDKHAPAKLKPTKPTRIDFDDFLDGAVVSAYGFEQLGGAKVPFGDTQTRRARAEFACCTPWLSPMVALSLA